jgi:hypothetical protein
LNQYVSQLIATWQTHEAEINKLKRRKALLELKATQMALESLKKISGNARNALSAIRADLGFPIDENWLKDLFDRRYKDVAELGQKTLVEFENRLTGATPPASNPQGEK